jgi:NAD(P)-dependent dehydrogenase (short-subunit alcohol dehydrogenase family)
LEKEKEKMSDKKVALITGANKGIGFETARQLGQQGIKILVGARSEERGKEAEAKLKGEGIDAEYIHLDLGDEKTHDSAAKYIGEKFAKLDILVNNAGIWLEGPEIKPASGVSLDTFRKTFDTNFFDQIAVTQKFLPLIKKSDAGRIVYLSSALGSNALHADPESQIWNFKVPAYDASKAALNSYTIHLAYELKDTPIKVNAVHPGSVETDMNVNGELKLAEGAKTSVDMATLPADGYTGKFVHLGQELPW